MSQPMSRAGELRALVAVVLTAISCSSASGTDISRTASGTGGSSGGGGTRNDVAASGGNGGGGTSNTTTLDSGTNDGFGVTISAAASSICAGDCTDLTASASGGLAPYTYQWDQGLADGAGPQHICPTASTTYTVTASDQAVTSGEFPRPSQQSTGSVTVTVNDCSMPDAALPPPPTGCQPAPSNACGLAIDNPSFEGPPGWATNPPAYFACEGSLSTQPTFMAPPVMATDGKTYLGIHSGGPGTADAAGQLLCGPPLQQGKTYTFKVDLGLGYDPGYSLATPGDFELWGGNDKCQKTELLWSQHVADSPFKTFCASFTPKANYTYIVITGSVPGGGSGFMVIDNIVPCAACN